MEIRMPLAEIGVLQVQRPGRKKRDKFYGKKWKINSYSSNALFVDENEVANQLAGMHITTPPKGQYKTSQRSNDETEVEEKRRSEARLQKNDANHRNVDAGHSTPVIIQQASPPVVRVQDVEYVRPLFAEANDPSNYDLPTFSALAKKVVKKFSITKVAEGSFGECYRMTGLKPSADLRIKEGCIMKILPINEEAHPDSSEWSSVAQLSQEVKIHKVLDSMPGFVRFREVYVVQGKYPPAFLTAFRNFKATPGNDAQNKDPEAEFTVSRQFAVFDMSDAGEDLEHLGQPSVFQIFDIFWSTAILLANAENTLEFEHRDLHIGNICFKSRSPGGRIDVNPMLNATMTEPPKIKLGLSHLSITIIDYTMSRATLNHETGEIAYNSMGTFNFESRGGCPEEKYQHQTYRRMRECVRRAEAAAQNTTPPAMTEQIETWSRFVPKTNVVWLIYLLVVLCKRADGKVVEGCNEVSKQLQGRMLAGFAEIMKRFKSCTVGRLPSSSAGLVDLGVEEGWLTKDDIEAFKEHLANDD
jgi:serine/threonine-protein kinase haspin